MIDILRFAFTFVSARVLLFNLPTVKIYALIETSKPFKTRYVLGFANPQVTIS